MNRQTYAAHKWPALLLVAALFLAASSSLAQEAGEAGWELRVCETKDNLPFSSQEAAGFENRIAEIVATELHAKLIYVWLPQPHSSRLEDALLREGECDLFMGVADGQEPFLTTLAYYQSSFVFVVRQDAPFEIESLDDAQLETLRIGVLRGSPPDFALAKRGIIEHVRHFLPRDPEGAIDAAVASGEIDVGIVWGPVAGYFAEQQAVDLTLTPVTPQIDLPYLPMVLAVSMGVRKDDVALRDLLNRSLAAKWGEVQAVLEDYEVPLLPLPKPLLGTGGL